MDFFTPKAVLVFFLILTRNSGMLLTAPIFGTGQMPNQVKVAVAFGLTIVMFPVVFPFTGDIPDQLVPFTLVAAKELAVGIMIGFMAGLMLTAIQLAGEYISHMMGLSIANVVDPVTSQHVPVVGQFYFILALLLFLFIDGHHWLIAAIQTSFEAVPIGFTFPGVQNAMQKILLMSSDMFSIALMLIFPIMAVLFVTEVALGFMAKVMPQMNIFVVGLPLKIYVGLLMMVMVMPMSQAFIISLFNKMSAYLYRLFV
jgi:flagellar biosynthetic protein FliR